MTPYEELTQNERIVVDDTLTYAVDRARAWEVPLPPEQGEVRNVLAQSIIMARVPA